MSREIKFRAWDGMKMCYSIELRGESHRLSDVFDLPLRWMQYTGLKDKNGKEIYEGDIVKGKITNYSIEFKQSGGWVTSDNLPLWAFHEPEVIGNIYENPDLLKGEPNE